MPSGNYEIQANAVQRREINPTTKSISSPQNILWSVTFFHTVNGIPILSAENDGIQMEFDADGLCSLEYYWRSVFDKKALNTPRIPAETAISNLKTINSDLSNNNMSYRQAHIYKDNISIPTWAIGSISAFHDTIFIDKRNGTPLEVGHRE